MSDKPPSRRFAARRRSTLALGGIAAAGLGLGLAGCDDTPAEPLRFTDVQQCISAGYERPFCEESYNAALAQHREDAPTYQSAAQCEAEWGGDACQRQGGSGIFTPLLVGFLVGQALDGRDRAYYHGGSAYYGSPIYRSRSGSPVTLTRGAGNAVRATPVNVGTTTVARSGFGGRGMARGGFGG